MSIINPRPPQRRPISKADEIRGQYTLNENIRSATVRLVGEDLDEISKVAGKNIEAGIYTTSEAIKWAYELAMDLVVITDKSNPPVCKIIDLNKFLYLKKKKEKEIKAKSAKVVLKEIRFGPNTDDHDFDFKLKHAIKFLEEGAKVKAYVQFRGRAIVYKERGELVLLKFLKELEPYGSAEELPKLEGKRMNLIISPRKAKS
ncbi:MAG TPA: translation initiation factor IF-3 [Saprospiraceae bacterium]|nr:translation initiation factor IF-3 [Saprospiraceae bacterium]HUN17361.1 translation initiation factor IF-3 [Saprospiraceae bacterium]